jgi:hypothetical protein
MISTGRKNNISSGTFKHGCFIKTSRGILMFTSYKTILGGSRSVFPGHFSGLQWRFGDLQQTSTRVYGNLSQIGNLCGKWVNDNLSHLCLGSCRVWLKKCPVGNDESRLFFATSPIPMNGCLVLPREIIQLKPSF